MEVKKKATHNALNVDKSILNTFWTLAESNKQTINDTTGHLVQSLMSKQKSNADKGMVKDLSYSVNRLVKGLSSSRESARQGYSVALCQILRHFTVVTVEDVLECVTTNLKYSNKMSKSEKGSIFLGKTLVFLSLIKSGRLCHASEKDVKSVVVQLRRIYKKKSYLQQICTNALVLLIQQITEEVLNSCVWPEIEADVTIGWESCTPDKLMLLMSCKKYQSGVVNKKFLKEHWNNSKIICENSYQHISRILADSCSCYPVVHLVVDEVIGEIIKSELPAGTFWTHCTRDLFSKHQTREIHTGFYVLTKILPCIKSVDDVHNLLSSTVTSVLMRNVNAKFKSGNPLYQGASHVIDKLVEYVRSCTDGGIQMAIVKLMWEDQGRRNVVKQLDTMIQQLTEEGAKSFGQYMIKSFCDGIKSSKSNGEQQEPGKLWDVVSEVRTLVTLASTSTDHQWQAELLQFLALHSFWIVTKPVTSVKHCEMATGMLDERLQKKFQDNLLKSLHNLLIFKTEKSKVSSVNAYIDTVYTLVQYVQTLFDCKEGVVPVSKLSDEAVCSWNNAFELINDLHVKNASSNVTSDIAIMDRAFELLLLYYMLQLFFDADNAVTVIQDLQSCHQRAFPIATKGKKSKKTEKNEPEWIAVITELLLSMMSQGSSLARITAKNVFGYLIRHVTPESLGLITNVLKMEKSEEGEEENQLGFEDDMDDEMESDESSDEVENGMDSDEMEQTEENAKNDDSEEVEDEESDDSESDEDDDDDEDEDEDVVDEDFRRSVKNALGDAADDEEGEDDGENDDEDLSDSEMFKFDQALASVFRNMKQTKIKEKTQRLKQIIAFKLRVLDLVETLVKSHTPPDLSLDLVMPLLELMVHGIKQKEWREIGNRATNLFHLLYKRAEVHGKSTVSKDRCLEFMKTIIGLSEEAPSKQVVVNVSDACLLVIRLLLNLEIGNVGPSPVKTRSQKAVTDKQNSKEKEKEEIHSQIIDLIKQSLDEFMNKRNHRLNPAFFHNLFSKYPVLFWPLTETLLNTLTDENIKVYCKTQACSMLSVMVNKDSKGHIEGEVWNDFSENLTQTLNIVIMSVSMENFKSGFLHEVLGLFNKYVHLSNNEQPVSKEVLDKLASLHDHFNTDTKRLYKKITVRLNQTKEQSSTDKKKKKKRKHKENEDDGETVVSTPKQKKSD